MSFDFSFSSPNSMVYSYPAHASSEEHHPQSFSNTKLPMFHPGVDDVGEAGRSNIGSLSGSRPRGRPRGSKNKPKENVLNVTSTMKSAVFEIPPGSDVVEWLKQFAQSRNICVNVLGGSGMISQVAISHMLSQHQVILTEKLTLISFTGIAGMISPSEPSVSCSFTAALGRLNGTVIGGTLTSLVTFGPVVLNVLISQNPEVIGAGYKTLA